MQAVTVFALVQCAGMVVITTAWRGDRSPVEAVAHGFVFAAILLCGLFPAWLAAELLRAKGGYRAVHAFLTRAVMPFSPSFLLVSARGKDVGHEFVLVLLLGVAAALTYERAAGEFRQFNERNPHWGPTLAGATVSAALACFLLFGLAMYVLAGLLSGGLVTGRP